MVRQRYWFFLLHRWGRFNLLKSAYSDHNQRSDNSEYDNERDGRDDCPVRPEEAIRWTGQRGNAFIILRRRRHIVGVRVAHFFAFSPSSTRRRMASARLGRSSRSADHASMLAISSSGIRNDRTGSLPVAGRPRFFGMTLFLNGFIFESYHNCSPTGRLKLPRRA
jgi:hypothetical protein